ncbi:3-dehydroquinate synthase [Sneathiella chinensis]|uniref:3-dehydroquinate synthase n=1 Tax=Sneathiella chinensis TaxID=349750 RepID=A0ABQ5U1T1_9PROT|nr:3-dehydroquinate synthase [Sneathiella chinensis]GLQ05626.1 3-dehydroquinate synthase [Sneathiella chinensis]
MQNRPQEAAQTPPERIVRVELGDRSYDIVVGANLLETAGVRLEQVLKRKRVTIITDETVARLHLETLQHSLDQSGFEHTAFIVKPGEGSKSLESYGALMNDILATNPARDECLIALGGGIVGDLTGFIAATLKRGMNFVQIPTTLLSQVDSSVGGKTGINSPYGKNLIGAFYQPKLVLADISLLATLPAREIRAGYAEVLKYALLGDFSFFEWLEKHGSAVMDGDLEARIHAVETSVRAKADIVAQDERESGVRALLNLGHTFGHALEAEVKYGPELVHGEGVALGMLMAMELSARSGAITTQDCERVASHYRATGLLTDLPAIEGLTWEARNLLSHMYQDKKVDQGNLTFIVLQAIGNAIRTQNVQEQEVLAVLDHFIQQSGKE